MKESIETKHLSLFQINHGGDVPEEYYLTNISEAKKEEMKKVVVGARTAHRVVCEVPQPQSVLKWMFFTTEYDIAYGVHHLNSRTPKDDLVCLINKINTIWIFGTQEFTAICAYKCKWLVGV